MLIYLNMKYRNINIGSLIEEKIIELGINKNQFAAKTGMHVQNLNRSIFGRKSIEIDKLIQISESLEFDFFQYYHPCENKESIEEDSIEQKDIQSMRDEIIKLRSENNILKKIVGIKEEDSPLEKEHVG